jgi:hypothetical protein
MDFHICHNITLSLTRFDIHVQATREVAAHELQWSLQFRVCYPNSMTYLEISPILRCKNQDLQISNWGYGWKRENARDKLGDKESVGLTGSPASRRDRG